MCQKVGGELLHDCPPRPEIWGGHVPPVDTPLMQTPTDSKFTLLQLTTHPELYKGVSECDTVGATFPNVSGAL